jgi:aspartate carbamoyltransferase regulatory subunit
MLNISGIENGYVIDHIEAGKSLKIYELLKLDKCDCPVAIIKNARSNKQGKKDIIKIEALIDLDLDLLGYLDDSVTVNVIRGGKIVEKKHLSLPTQITDVVKCKNPRCITSIEQGLPHVFILTDAEKRVYRCKYCEEQLEKGRKKK